jgi:hypothetical protein
MDARVLSCRFALFVTRDERILTLCYGSSLPLVLVATITDNAAQINNVIIAGNDDQDF